MLDNNIDAFLIRSIFTPFYFYLSYVYLSYAFEKRHYIKGIVIATALFQTICK